eukprot:Phypoly_transcript_03610.p1 GENE.Phypoly_transcript_03610~~Phypoly_transcript_03610.p1  ORF type:complete len:538 (+),score=64.14 Phypoly_transcript_03610:492-2105(+)
MIQPEDILCRLCHKTITTKRQKNKKRVAGVSCPTCRQLLYCSQECRQAHAPVHVKECETRPLYASNTPPNLGKPIPESVRRDSTGAWGSPQEIEEAAKKGDANAQYLMGCFYSLRMGISYEHDSEKINVGTRIHSQSEQTTNELAVEWFRKSAAQGNLSAMYSLANKYFDGKGVRKDHREGMNICAQILAIDPNHEGVAQKLEYESMLCKDTEASFQSIVENMDRLRGRSLRITSPNLVGLLFTLCRDYLRANSYAPMLGKEICLQLDKITKDNHIDVAFGYGRAGTAKQATQLTLEGAPKEPLFSVRYKIASENAPDFPDMNNASWNCRSIPAFNFLCVHSAENVPHSNCERCEKEAQGRLLAVCHGMFALAQDETRPTYGYDAIFVDGMTGEKKIEGFKSYSRPEMECVLRILGATNVNFLHPLFLAQDPNLFWPIYANCGSIFSALTKIFATVNWGEKMGTQFTPNLGFSAAEKWVPEIMKGKESIRCGNPPCTELENSAIAKFPFCSKCKRKKYHCQECQRAHWPEHKKECVL